MMKSKGCRQQLKGALAAKLGHQKRETFARPASLLAPSRLAETAAPSSDANWSKKPPDLSEDKREIIFFNSCQRDHGSFPSTILCYILFQPLLCKALFLYLFKTIEPPSTSHLKGEPVLLQRFNDELVKGKELFEPKF